MKNLQMMRAEPRQEDQNVNVVLRSEIKSGDDKGKQPEEDGWVHKGPKKEVGFHLECPKETFLEAKKSLAEASTSGSENKVQEISAPTKVDPSMLTTFLEICMKLLCNKKL